MLISLIENIIYNNKCKTCGKTFYFKNQNLFCENCTSKIKQSNLIYCKSCGKKTSYCINCIKERKFDEIKIFTTYSGILKEMIKNYKFGNYKNLSKTLADIIKNDFQDFLESKKIDFILYVPSSYKKVKERGFDHLYEILIKLLPKAVIRQDLIKIKETKLQVQLDKKERQENLKGAFEIKNPYIYKNKNILIFDDIITTGATLMECFYTVKKANPCKIYSYVIAC